MDCASESTNAGTSLARSGAEGFHPNFSRALEDRIRAFVPQRAAACPLKKSASGALMVSSSSSDDLIKPCRRHSFAIRALRCPNDYV